MYDIENVRIPMTIRVRQLRFFLVSILLCAAALMLLVVFYGQAIVLRSFLASDSTPDEQLELLEDYNSYVALVTSAVALPVMWLASVLLPVAFLCLAPGLVMKVDQSLLTKSVIVLVTIVVEYLLINAFMGVFVQTSSETIVPVIATSDLSVGLSAEIAYLLLNASSVSKLVPEKKANNSVGNTVLRNAIAPAVFDWTPVCGNGEPVSSLEAVVQSFGFPQREWQSTMLPFALSNASLTISSSDDENEDSNTNLPMNSTRAANLLINALHMSRHFFRWFDNTSQPFNLTTLVEESFQPENATNTSAAGQTHSVLASELLNLIPSEQVSEVVRNDWFVGSARDLFQASLNGAVNISKAESNLTFSHVDISESLAFDAVTFDIPLRKNFFYRKLIQDTNSTALSADANATALYSNASNAGNTSNIYYDLDIASDCGATAGVCVMPRVQEYDVNGNEYQPNAQIKALAICLNDNGDEDFQIDYSYAYSTNGTASTNVSWACPTTSSTSMWIVSLSMRIVGDAMYQHSAPDDTTTELDGSRVTIVNPRKIYSLTVGRLGWETMDLAQEYNAQCQQGSNECQGLHYLLNNDTASSSVEGNTEKHLILGSSSIPVNRLSPFAYNSTESDASASTRWTPLMTLTTSASAEGGNSKRDLLLGYNFKSVKWSSNAKGASCSASVEAYLHQIVDNHYYMESGLQATYTSAVFFLFQNAVVRSILTPAGVAAAASTTLSFDGNQRWIHLTIDVPPLSFFLTILGVGILLLLTIVIVGKTCTKAHASHGLRHPQFISAEMVAQMMFNENKYPPMLLVRNFDNVFMVGQSDSITDFKVDGITVRHSWKGEPFALPVDNMLILDGGLSCRTSQWPYHRSDDEVSRESIVQML